jgi:hypothetical protein
MSRVNGRIDPLSNVGLISVGSTKIDWEQNDCSTLQKHKKDKVLTEMVDDYLQ